MPYLGNIPATNFSTISYQDLTGGTGTSFTLDFAAGSAQDIEVFVNNVRQEPGVAYTVSGTSLTMTGSIAASDDFYVVFQGKAQQSVTHPSNSALVATTGTFSGDLTVDTNTLYVDSTNNRVGIVNASPSVELDVTGAAKVSGDLTVDTNTLYVDSTNNRVGIGTTSPSGKLNLATGASSACELRLTSNNTGSGAGDRGRIVVYSSRNDGTAYEAGKIEIDRSSGTADQAHMIFATNGGSGNTEHMRIDANGTLIVNDTSRTLGCPMHLTYDGANEQGICLENIANSTSGAAIRFIDHAGSFNSGGIYFATSNSILYSTTSDYRLKENVTADWDATTRLKQLNPVRFNFISDAATTVDGFLAHEVQTVVPEAIIGTHNAVETWTQRQIDNGEAPDGTSAGDNKLDEDGNTIPMYQGIDQSKLVPLLIKTVQELEARIAALENA